MTQRDFAQSADALQLSAPARAALRNADDFISLLNSRGKTCVNTPAFSLHGKRWQALEKSLKKASKGEVSLLTHTFKGFRLEAAA